MYVWVGGCIVLPNPLWGQGNVRACVVFVGVWVGVFLRVLVYFVCLRGCVCMYV
jgi:high-affinity Fe2+/Pb2+ permease